MGSVESSNTVCEEALRRRKEQLDRLVSAMSTLSRDQGAGKTVSESSLDEATKRFARKFCNFYNLTCNEESCLPVAAARPQFGVQPRELIDGMNDPEQFVGNDTLVDAGSPLEGYGMVRNGTEVVGVPIACPGPWGILARADPSTLLIIGMIGFIVTLMIVGGLFIAIIEYCRGCHQRRPFPDEQQAEAISSRVRRDTFAHCGCRDRAPSEVSNLTGNLTPFRRPLPGDLARTSRPVSWAAREGVTLPEFVLRSQPSSAYATTCVVNPMTDGNLAGHVVYSEPSSP